MSILKKFLRELCIIFILLIAVSMCFKINFLFGKIISVILIATSVISLFNPIPDTVFKNRFFSFFFLLLIISLLGVAQDNKNKENQVKTKTHTPTKNYVTVKEDKETLKKIEDKHGNVFTFISKDKTEINEFLKCYDGYLKNDIQQTYDLAEYHYQDGNVIKRDLKKAISIYEKIFAMKVKGTEVELDRKMKSALAMANIYRMGEEYIQKDINKSLEWYYRAAQAEFNYSMKGYRLIPINEEKGMDWGLLNLHEEVKERRNKIALDYIQKLISEGNFLAMYRLGLLYKNKNIPSPSIHSSYNLFKKASNLGHKPSCQELNQNDWSVCD